MLDLFCNITCILRSYLCFQIKNKQATRLTLFLMLPVIISSPEQHSGRAVVLHPVSALAFANVKILRLKDAIISKPCDGFGSYLV